MKIELETIPIHDAFSIDSECPICSLMQKSEEHWILYYLGSSVMHPETRVEVNEKGFCNIHFKKLSTAKKAQALALLCSTFIQKTLESFDKDYKINGFSINNSIDKINENLKKRDKGCLICNRLKDNLKRYCFTVSSLYKEDESFKEKLLNSKGFCLYHTRSILEYSKFSLNNKERKEFVKAILDLEKKKLQRLMHDAIELTQMYKSENRGKDYSLYLDAHKKAVDSLVGMARTYDD